MESDHNHYQSAGYRWRTAYQDWLGTPARLRGRFLPSHSAVSQSIDEEGDVTLLKFGHCNLRLLVAEQPPPWGNTHMVDTSPFPHTLIADSLRAHLAELIRIRRHTRVYLQAFVDTPEAICRD